MKKLFLLLVVFFTAQLSAQNISGCITSMPDSISNIKVAYVRGKGLAVKQEIPVKMAVSMLRGSTPNKGFSSFTSMEVTLLIWLCPMAT